MIIPRSIKFHKFPHLQLNPVQVLSAGFALVILAGGIILSLPISSASGLPTPFIDSLFTSTTSICVTGLVTLDTGTHWSLFGKTVIMLLIQTGGLGFMTFATITAVFLGRKLGLKNRLVMQEAYNTFNIQGIIKMVKYVISFTLGLEGIGALILMTQFIPIYGWGTGIYFGIFHSISAFCNAGIDLIGDFRSVTIFNTNKILLITIMTLIVVGGLGFSVWIEIWNFKSLRKLSFHAKIVITTSLILMFGGAFFLFIFEFNNPATMQGMSLFDKVVNAMFSSITPRTAGFNSISTSEMSMGGRILTMLLMFVGGSPGSTAGGIKTTALGVLFLTVISILKGRDDPEAFGKRLEKATVHKAFAVFTIGLVIVFSVTFILAFAEAGTTISFENIFYEAISAFATVGLTQGITPELHSVSKAALMAGMYLGRVGPLTVMLALSRHKNPAKLTYPEGKILIG